MMGQTKPEPGRRSTSSLCCTHQKGRRRAYHPFRCLAVGAFVWVMAPLSTAWVVPLSHRDASSSMRRFRSGTRKEPVLSWQTRQVGRARRSSSLSLSSAPTVDRTSAVVDAPQLGQMVNDNPPRTGDGLTTPSMPFIDRREDRDNAPLHEGEQNFEGRGQTGFEGRGQTGFEGPEKTLEIEFDPDIGHQEGLRAIRREQWDAILEQAQCKILNYRGNECFDSYVLSESSLFVYKSKLVLKTCGTTTLLRCLPLLTVVSKNYGLSLEWIGYSRKDFTFPTDQIYPHTSFAEEVDFLQTMFSGSAYVHGPLNSDHWYTYVADDCRRPTSAAADRTLNLMMYDLEPSVAKNFFASDQIRTAEDVSSRTGIKGVLPKATLQDHLFEPCGYSMNALEGRAYSTIHVTPETDFSYASFETNVRLPDYDELVKGILEVFRPKKFTMTLFADKTGMENIKENPFDCSEIDCSPTTVSSESVRYLRTLKTTTNFSGDYLSQMGNWVRELPKVVPSVSAPVVTQAA